MLNQQLEQQIEDGRLDERLVALEIEDQVGVELAGDLGDAVGAAGMIAARADDAAAKALDGRDDARIVRGDDDVVGTPAPGRRVRRRAAPDTCRFGAAAVCRADGSKRSERE